MDANGKFFGSKPLAGFTLLELLVLVLFVLIFVALVSPWPTTSHSIERALATRHLYEGRRIHQALFSAEFTGAYPMKKEFGGNWYFPEADAAWHGGTSTGFFAFLMKPEIAVLGQDFQWYSPLNIGASRSLENFGPENNMWSVVAGGKAQSTATPFLVSRNLNESALKDWRPDENLRLERVGSRGGEGAHTTPWNRDRIVVVRYSGGGEILTEGFLRWSLLNPDSATHPILQP